MRGICDPGRRHVVRTAPELDRLWGTSRHTELEGHSQYMLSPTKVVIGHGVRFG